MLGVLAEATSEPIIQGNWTSVLVAAVLGVPTVIVGWLAYLGALRSKRAVFNTQPNGGASAHDQVVKGQEYTIGLIHGMNEEMRTNFAEVAGKATDAVHVSALAAAAVKQSDIQTAEIKKLLENHLKNSEEYGAAFTKAGTEVVEQLNSLKEIAMTNRDRIEKLEQEDAQGLSPGKT